ncbi:hypothetical protein B0T19DRAFT_423480 [Cercophora scortea]|uniref:Uncharacterized protein n=1 Tax=Cercophora scortea TaxID=314031 RepID=A0AAE0IPB2_9PEZI|nr:hypothetical protein B0T19DRAFT_423480 [Cercophora scortea]
MSPSAPEQQPPAHSSSRPVSPAAWGFLLLLRSRPGTGDLVLSHFLLDSVPALWHARTMRVCPAAERSAENALSAHSQSWTQTYKTRHSLILYWINRPGNPSLPSLPPSHDPPIGLSQSPLTTTPQSLLSLPATFFCVCMSEVVSRGILVSFTDEACSCLATRASARTHKHTSDARN